MVDPAPTDPRPYLRLAKRYVPELPIRVARAINHGWGSFVLEVNREWIFRFPRTVQDSLAVAREAKLLEALAPRLPVPVPRYDRIVRNSRGRIVLVTYPKLPGRSLPSRDLAGARGRRWRVEMIELLGALEEFPRELARRLDVMWWRRSSALARWEYLYPLVLRKVHPRLPPGVRERDRDYWEAYLKLARKAPPETILTHGDLSPEHILVDDRTITGIIDWESACFEDPVGDVTMLPSADGFADAVSRGRFGDRDVDWVRRVAFHRHAVPVYSILFALDHRDGPALRTELAQYRRTLPDAG